MRTIISIIIFIAGLALGLFAAANGMQNNSIKRTVVETFTGIPPAASEVQVEGQRVVGWIPYWDQERAFQSLTRNHKAFDYISLFWYYLSPEGKIVKYEPAREDRSIIAFVHAHGMKALMLVANLPDTGGGDWDSERVDRVIATYDDRTKHIADIMSLVDRYNFDGVNIDYEALESYQKENFTLFIQELSQAMHEKGKIVAVALHPKTGEGKRSESNGSQGQDWHELGKYADQLHLMTYEQSTAGTKPGPTAASSWSKRVITYAKKLIPNNKIYLGIGLYGYEWPQNHQGKVRGLTYAQVDQIIAAYAPEVLRDEASGEPYFVYENEEGKEFEIWYNDAESVRRRLEFAKEENIRGVAFWRLGGEDTKVWELFKE